MYPEEFKKKVKTLLLMAGHHKDGKARHPDCPFGSLPHELLLEIIKLDARTYGNEDLFFSFCSLFLI